MPRRTKHSDINRKSRRTIKRKTRRYTKRTSRRTKKRKNVKRTKLNKQKLSSRKLERRKPGAGGGQPSRYSIGEHVYCRAQYTIGEHVYYIPKDWPLERASIAEIVHVGQQIGDEYITIKLPDGNERNTTIDRIMEEIPSRTADPRGLPPFDHALSPFGPPRPHVLQKGEDLAAKLRECQSEKERLRAAAVRDRADIEDTAERELRQREMAELFKRLADTFQPSPPQPEPEPEVATPPPPPSSGPAAEKDWAQMTVAEQKAAATLGWTEASWTAGDTVPLLKPWYALARHEQAAAERMGYAEDDFWQKPGDHGSPPRPQPEPEPEPEPEPGLTGGRPGPLARTADK